MKMQGAVIYETGKPRPYAQSTPLIIETLDLDGPQQNEVLVEIRAAGLCHSDLSTIEGIRARPLPTVLGHEAAGIVREVGPGVREQNEGRVDRRRASTEPQRQADQPCRRGVLLCAIRGVGSRLYGKTAERHQF